MENPLSTEALLENTSEIKKTEESIASEQGIVRPHQKSRHIFLIILVFLTVAVILFLIYQNGKSIYDEGI